MVYLPKDCRLLSAIRLKTFTADTLIGKLACFEAQGVKLASFSCRQWDRILGFLTTVSVHLLLSQDSRPWAPLALWVLLPEKIFNWRFLHIEIFIVLLYLSSRHRSSWLLSPADPKEGDHWTPGCYTRSFPTDSSGHSSSGFTLVLFLPTRQHTGQLSPAFSVCRHTTLYGCKLYFTRQNWSKFYLIFILTRQVLV